MAHLLSSAQVCETLTIDRSTLTRWVAAERIVPAHKLPGVTGAYLFDPDEVDRLKRELSSASTAGDPAP